jgi:hypothetical protein
MAGKGSKPRSFSVSQDTYGENWDNIFKKKKPTEKPVSEKKKPKIQTGSINPAGS